MQRIYRINIVTQHSRYDLLLVTGRDNFANTLNCANFVEFQSERNIRSQ